MQGFLNNYKGLQDGNSNTLKQAWGPSMGEVL